MSADAVCGDRPSILSLKEQLLVCEIPEISATVFKQRLAAREDLLVIDVREAHERANGHLADTHHIPLGQLEGVALSLPRGKTVIAYCQSGMRSKRAVEILAQKGFSALSLTGGYLKASAE